jgi:hypothetical protein
LSPCLAGRAQGTVVSLKGNFGFVQLSHRNLDVYFRVADIFPIHIQKDLLNSVENGVEEVKVGSEISFDLSISPPGNSGGGSKRNSNRVSNVKEQIRAQRLALLPPGSIETHKSYTSVTGTIVKVENFNKYCGVVKLNEKIQGMTTLERYPLLKKLLDDFENENATALHFSDVQSEEENDIIFSAIEDRSGLEIVFTPVVDFGDLNRGRITITKTIDVSNSISNDTISGADTESPVPPEAENADVIENKNNIENDEETDDMQVSITASKSKQKKKQSNTIKNLTYDRSSILPHLADNPPKTGDKVQMDIVYAQNIGRFIVSNLDVTERCPDKGDIVKYNLCEGYVLLEPRYTSLSKASNKSKRKGFSGNDDNDDRWGPSTADSDNSDADDGLILLLNDPANLFEQKKTELPLTKEDKEETCSGSKEVEMVLHQETDSELLRIPFTLASVGRGESNPKRGDKVSFVKGKGNKARDVRVIQSGIAPRVKGKLIEINTATGTSMFVKDESETTVAVKLSDVVGCNPSVLKDEVTVEGIEYEDLIVGIFSLQIR